MANEISENMWKIMKKNKFQLINEINNDLICNICNKLMVKACNAPCNCKYCSDCIAKYLDGKDKFCPGKDKFCQKRKINFKKDIVINYQTNRRIAETFVKCPNKYCEFTVELRLIENHMKTCNKNPKSCPYFEIGCINEEVIIDKMKDHLCTEIYSHTKLLLDFINNLRNEMESMKNDIVELKLENKNLKQELDKIKIESKNNQIENEEFENNIKNNLLEIEELNPEMVVIKNENRSLMDKLENIEKSRINEEIKSEQQTGEIDEMKEKYEQTENKEIEMKRIIDEIFDKNADLINKSNNCDEKINNLQMEIIEMETFTEKNNFREIKWKIQNFSTKVREKLIDSESFYSHKNGYKMCLSVSIGYRFDFVVVYFHLMRGEFDNHLMWPFKHDITIDIINQKNGEVDRSKTIKYNDYPNSKGWNKPNAERNNPFLFHEINNLKEIIQNNQMLIKCKIKI